LIKRSVDTKVGRQNQANQPKARDERESLNLATSVFVNCLERIKNVDHWQDSTSVGRKPLGQQAFCQLTHAGQTLGQMFGGHVFVILFTVIKMRALDTNVGKQLS
jgi:hypothetical protein